ncbi:MAG: phage integrase N-terminal SAM-like domain-containing protein [Spirulinaceae cyanobacterium]
MTATPPLKKLLDVVREVSRLKHNSYHTKQTYIDWIKQYLCFCSKHPPRERRIPEVQAFLSGN